MLARLPELIEPLVLADRNASIEGELPIAGFDRIAEMLSDNTKNVAVKLLFGKKGKLATVEGHVSAVLGLKCQRCLETVEWPINSEFKLGLISSLAQANKLPEDYEALLLVDGEKILLKNIVEDELLLSIPDIPKHHDQDDCVMPNFPKNKPETLPKIVQAATVNPFSVLTDLKNLKKLESTNGSTKK
jgi:uncharacterized protein